MKPAVDVPTHRTIPDHVLRHAQRHEDRPALVSLAVQRRIVLSLDSTDVQIMETDGQREFEISCSTCNS